MFITDRSANIIITGGVNVYPAEVDAVLLEHRAVAATPELANELIDFCRARLARFKCPRTVDFVDSRPRQDNGKIYKRLLRDRYRA